MRPFALPEPSGCLARVVPWTVAMLWANSLVPGVLGTYTPYLTQGFFFDWTPAGQSPPVPTTAQCDTISIEFGRGNAVGPNPVAPYYLQVYTSSFIVPLVVPAGDSNGGLTFDWPVPFIPGTQYQICMFDSNGVTGGCQAMYTVYPAANHTLNNPPVCTNLTYPQPDKVLGVTALVDNGPLGQYAWVDQCTDISLTPTNGTPPYTMTVAPALHPPYNITSKTKDAINWTVTLSWGMPFFVSLVDSSGMSWAYGPLHSGQGSSSACLALPDSTSTATEIKPWVAAVSGVGGLLVGLIAGLLGALFFLAQRRRTQHGRIRPDTIHRKSSSISITTPVLRMSPRDRYTDLPTPPAGYLPQLRDQSYQIEPFVMPSEHELGVRSSRHGVDSTSGTLVNNSTHHRDISDDRSRSPTSSALSPTSTTPALASAPLVPPHRPLSPEHRSASQVFVVHHDGGRPPVTVYAADGTEIVELPPRYVESGADGPSGNPSARTGAVRPLQVQERREGGPTPPKQRRVIN